MSDIAFNCRMCGQKDESAFYSYLKSCCKNCKRKKSKETHNEKVVAKKDEEQEKLLSSPLGVQVHYILTHLISNDPIMKGGTIPEMLDYLDESLSDLLVKTNAAQDKFNEYVKNYIIKKEEMEAKILILKDRIDEVRNESKNSQSLLMELVKTLVRKNDELENKIEMLNQKFLNN